MTAAGVARLDFEQDVRTEIATGVAVLDHLLTELAEAGRFALALEIAPDEPEAEVGRAGAALGQALLPLFDVRAGVSRGFGVAPADEALALVVVEASGRPLVASNADLTSTRAGGLHADMAATFLQSLAEAAGLTVHVRLIEGESSEHVLSAIFKALGVALARAAAADR